MRILVTGAAGFLGRTLVQRLVAEGHEVIGLVRAAPSRASLEGPLRGAQILEEDLALFDPAKLPVGVDAVYSVAQSSRFREFPEQANEIFAVNVTANLRLFDWARLQGVSRFVFASSGGIYGGHAKPFVSEQDPLPLHTPLGFYLAAKVCGEVLFQNYGAFFRTAAILRPFFLYGPGQRRDMLIPRLISSVRDGESIRLQGPDGFRFNPVYVEDAATAFAAALEVEGRHVFNIAGPDVLSLREVSEAIGRFLGRRPVFDEIAGEPSHYVANADRARVMLRTPQTPFSDGLAHTMSGE